MARVKRSWARVLATSAAIAFSQGPWGLQASSGPDAVSVRGVCHPSVGTSPSGDDGMTAGVAATVASVVADGNSTTGFDAGPVTPLWAQPYAAVMATARTSLE